MDPTHPHGDRSAVMEGVDPLSAEVFGAFRRAMHLSKQLLGRMMAEKGGHPGAAGMLRVLSHNEGITQRDLADMLHVSRPTVTAMLQKLEQHGLIERWDDEADQRLTRIRLTDAGREQATMFEASFAQYVDGTVGTMAEDDRRELARLLGLLADTMAGSLARYEETEPSGDDD